MVCAFSTSTCDVQYVTIIDIVLKTVGKEGKVKEWRKKFKEMDKRKHNVNENQRNERKNSEVTRKIKGKTGLKKKGRPMVLKKRAIQLVTIVEYDGELIDKIWKMDDEEEIKIFGSSGKI
ncbi:hypothetical protein C1645_812301 [Glomus cerebriforme]|uniref:Uncharacterized protein n=1 Tax=Glomus cerebriforme TaxID=658196 RepID=A0A397TKP5_9GLOM|nr:hypothetical protein C1645_812301 [Glomus cerebriforme]